jgi:hypothetical protein
MDLPLGHQCALHVGRIGSADTREAFEMAFLHKDWSVVRHALIIGDQLPKDSELSRVVTDWLSEIIHYRNEPRLILQIALSLGEFQTAGALDALAYLANQHGDIRWMDTALVSSVYGREEGLLSRVLLGGGSDSTLWPKHSLQLLLPAEMPSKSRKQKPLLNF